MGYLNQGINLPNQQSELFQPQKLELLMQQLLHYCGGKTPLPALYQHDDQEVEPETFDRATIRFVTLKQTKYDNISNRFLGKLQCSIVCRSLCNNLLQTTPCPFNNERKVSGSELPKLKSQSLLSQMLQYRVVLQLAPQIFIPEQNHSWYVQKQSLKQDQHINLLQAQQRMLNVHWHMCQE